MQAKSQQSTFVIESRFLEPATSETALQMGVVRFLKYLIFNRMLPFTINHSPNEEASDDARKKNWYMGTWGGHPDLDIFFNGGKVAFIEFKLPTTPTSGWQLDRHAILRDFGFKVHVIRVATVMQAIERVIEILTENGVEGAQIDD
jgi:hypothetical protein